jgi:U3 small nucleolar RNA-associated protein 14
MGKEYVEDSDHEDMGEAGNRLAEAVSRLDKTQYIKSATKANAAAGGRTVRVKGLLNLLSKTSDLAEVGRNLREVTKHKGALEKPLEKRQAEKIKRSTGFEQVKAALDRWNSVVAKNRTAEYREFPLVNAEDKKREPADASITKYMIKSELELELENLNPNSEETQQEKHFPLTMAEMIEHRKEAARLRAKQSYKEAKARRQSKIKSKKFHRYTLFHILFLFIIIIVGRSPSTAGCASSILFHSCLS